MQFSSKQGLIEKLEKLSILLHFLTQNNLIELTT